MQTDANNPQVVAQAKSAIDSINAHQRKADAAAISLQRQRSSALYAEWRQQEASAISLQRQRSAALISQWKSDTAMQIQEARRAAREVQRIEAETVRQAAYNAKILERAETQLANHKIKEAERYAKQQAKEFERTIQQQRNASNESGGGVFGAAAIGGAIGSGIGLLGAAAIYKITGLLREGSQAWIDYSSKIENSKIAFTNMLGSEQAAEEHLRALQRFALETPFQFGDLVDASQRMQALGFNAKEVIPILKDVGNAVAAAGGGQDRLDRVIKALADVRGKEKLQSQEIRQFAEAGISVYKILGEETGKTTAQIQKMVEAGEISSDQFLAAFQKYSQIHFGDLMAQQSRTFTGALSNIKDALLALGTEAFLPTFNLIRDKMNELQDSLSTNKDEWKSWADFVATQVGYVLEGVQTVAHAIEGLGMALNWFSDKVDNSKESDWGLFPALKSYKESLFGDRWANTDEHGRPIVPGPRSIPLLPQFDPFGQTNIYSQIAPELDKVKVIPRPKTSGTGEDSMTSAQRTKAERAARDREIIAAMREKIDELAADFMENFGKALPYHFGQTGLHTKLNYDHRAAADISLDARTSEGQFVMEWLSEHGINARASLGKEVSKTTGKLISTGVHIHAGELSGAMGRGLKLREGLLSPRALKEQQEAYQSPFYGMTTQEVAKYLADKRANAPIETRDLELAPLPPDLQRTWDLYYEDMFKREEELKNRRKDFGDEFLAASRNQITEIGNLELDLAHLRRQNTDDQFVEQRRLLAAKGEQVDLERELAKVQDDIATGPYNESLRIQLALLQDIASMRRRDEEAIISQNRSQLELADQSVFHAQEARARIMESMAKSGGITDAISDAFIASATLVDNTVTRLLDHVNAGLGGIGRIITDIESTFIRMISNRLIMKVVDWLLGGASSNGGGGGFSFGGASVAGGAVASVLPGLFMGGGGFQNGIGSTNGGGINLASLIQNPFAALFGGGGASANGPTINTYAQQAAGATWGNFKLGSPGDFIPLLKGFGGGGLLKGLGGMAAGLAPMLPLLGASLGAGLGKGSTPGSIMGLLGGGLAGVGILAGLSAATLGGIGGSIGASLATGLGGIFGTTSGLGGIFAGLFGGAGSMASFAAIAGPAALIAIPLLIGASLLSRNKQRRKEEEIRNTTILDAFSQLDRIKHLVEIHRMDGAEGVDQAMQIRAQYVQQMSQLKDKKTRSHALADVSRLDIKIAAIKSAATKALNETDFDRKLIPEFAIGGVVPGRPGSPQLVLAHGGEVILNAAQQSVVGTATLAQANVPGVRGNSSGSSEGGVQVEVSFGTQTQDRILVNGLEQPRARRKLGRTVNELIKGGEIG